MKERIIEAIRAVPIAGKTYEEYVEALAEELQNSECGIRNAELRVAGDLIGEIEAFASKQLLILELLNPEKSGVAAGGKHAFDLLLELLAELKKKYTEGKR